MSEAHVAIVTGGAGGIGLATVRKFAQRHVAVAIADLNAEAGEAAAAALNAEGGKAIFVRLNVGDRQSWSSAVGTVSEKLGPVDILVNCAGILRDRSLVKMTDQEWEDVISVNLRGTWLGCQAVFPGMSAKKWGRIVNISSSSHRGTFGQSNYAAAKAGVIGLTRTIALEGMKFGILCNAVIPHTVETAILAKVPEETKEKWKQNSKVGRFAQPEEIAAVIDFFASDDNTFVNGQMLEVDGGELVGA